MSVNHAYSALSFISFVLVLIPLPWHMESWNVGTCIFMIATAVSLLINFVNSIIWDGNAIDSAVVWCELSTRLMFVSGLAIHSASLVIMRRLYYIASDRSAGRTPAEKKRAMLIDFSIGLIPPFVQMALYYVVQGNRYNILEDYGCVPVVSNSSLSLVIMTLPPLVFSLVSATFGCLSIIAFLKRRAEFSDTLSTHSNLNASRYLRLMMLGSMDILVTVPYTSIYLWLNTAVTELYPYDWDFTHGGFDRVDSFPAVLWKSQSYAWAGELPRWMCILAALVFFSFFGFSEEARKRYHPLLSSSMRAINKTGWSSSQVSGTNTAVSATLPTFKVTSSQSTASVQPHKHVSILSFSSEISLGMDEKMPNTPQSAASTQTDFDDDKIRPKTNIV